MTEDDVEVLDKATPFKGHFQIDRYSLRHRLFEGGWSGAMTREVFERGHAVAALLYDPDRDRIVLIEQFRSGALAALASPLCKGRFSPWLIEIVAGIIETGETPEDVVRREAREETGCTVLDVVRALHYLPSPGGSSESVHVFAAKVDARKAGGIHGMTHEHENIRVFTVSPDEAFQLLDEGRIHNAMTLIALQWFRGTIDDLRRRWQSA
ncbi:MAG: NUDIX domain-containing protein [Rhodospirillales bacterium]|nr:NUDIX domain-containing protein [Rhodospirillales bacterium]